MTRPTRQPAASNNNELLGIMAVFGPSAIALAVLLGISALCVVIAVVILAGLLLSSLGPKRLQSRMELPSSDTSTYI